MRTVGAVAAVPAGRVVAGHSGPAWLAWVGLGLAVVAGFVDAIGFLGLFHLYAAHMSGNTASAGADLGRLDWGSAVHSTFPILIFLLGVCAGALMKQAGVRRGIRSWFALACIVEAALLAALMVFGGTPASSGDLVENSPAYFVLIVLPCLAMGIQSATFQRVGTIGVRTTFVTGILTGLGEELVAAVYGLRDRPTTTDHGEAVAASSALEGTLERAALFAGIWLAYLVGGVLAGVGQQLWALGALVLPVLGLLGLALVDLVHPIQPGRP
jgi:uncharacterized membrane protein YoaK (UPF0700 family)